MARQTVPGLLHAAATPASSPGFVTPVFTAIACVVPPKRRSSALQQSEGSIYCLSIKYLWCAGALIKNHPPKGAALCCSQHSSHAPRKPGGGGATWIAFDLLGLLEAEVWSPPHTHTAPPAHKTLPVSTGSVGEKALSTWGPEVSFLAS